MSTFYDNILDASDGLISRAVEDRQRLTRNETEEHLRALALDYEARAGQLWNRDYSSVAAFLKSVEPNRKRWLQAVGDFGEPLPKMDATTEPFIEDSKVLGVWVTIRLFEKMNARAVLAIPKTKTGPLPVVLCQHGIGSTPERVFGFDDPQCLYHAYGRRLVEDGYAVLAPLNTTEARPRARLHRIALLLGKTLWGLEICKIRRFVDFLCNDARFAPERIAMWGLSLGGAYTLLTTPLEPRIKVAICSAWFNHRVRKMVVDDSRYSCFLSAEEEHIFIPGWLREFSDSDLVSLICPRPLHVQAGKCDGISWWSFLAEEFGRAREHYVRLGLGDRIELHLHEAGHEIRYEEGAAFLRKWL